MDGSPPIGKDRWGNTHLLKQHTSLTAYPRVMVKAADGRTYASFKTHRAVALLWGALKLTAYPMSDLLVVDHKKEGNVSDFRLDNLLIVTQEQNRRKGNYFRTRVDPDGLMPVRPVRTVARAAAGTGT